MKAFWKGFERGLAITAIVTGLSMIGACGPWQRGPFVPFNAKSCGADPDCPDGMQCRFPGVDTHAVCMPGDNEATPSLPQ